MFCKTINYYLLIIVNNKSFQLIQSAVITFETFLGYYSLKLYD